MKIKDLTPSTEAIAMQAALDAYIRCAKTGQAVLGMSFRGMDGSANAVTEHQAQKMLQAAGVLDQVITIHPAMGGPPFEFTTLAAAFVPSSAASLAELAAELEDTLIEQNS